MLCKPSELPFGEEAEIDPALAKVTEWKLENSEPLPPADESVNFVEENITSMFDGFRRAFRLIERKLAIRPAH